MLLPGPTLGRRALWHSRKLCVTLPHILYASIISKADGLKGISLYSECNSLLMSSGRPLTQRGANFEASFRIHTLCVFIQVCVCVWGVRAQTQLALQAPLPWLSAFVLRRGLSLIWNVPTSLGWPAREP